MSRPKNLLYAFAVRLLLVLIANNIIWTLTVKLYYQHDTTKQTLGFVKEELHNLEPQIRQIVYDRRIEFKPFLKEVMGEHEIPFLEIYMINEGLIFNQGEQFLPKSLRRFPDELPGRDDPSYTIFEKNNTHYLYLFTPVFEHGWYMRTAIPIRQELIDRIGKTTETVIIVVIITLLQVTLVLFPLMLASYQRTLRDRAKLVMNQLMTVLTLGNAIGKRDSDTDTHNYRVSYYALRLAEKIGLEADRMPGLIKGAFLHDLGKIGVPDNILLKPGRLNEKEFDIVQKHVKDGLDIIAVMPWLRDASPVIGAHHEKFDGSGYPNGLQGDDIPLEARIFSIVDVFDALTSRRPYKEAMTLEGALQIMDEASGKHFDPEIYSDFKKIAHSLLSRACTSNRHKLRKLLGRAILPYYPLILDQGND